MLESAYLVKDKTFGNSKVKLKNNYNIFLSEL